MKGMQKMVVVAVIVIVATVPAVVISRANNKAVPTTTPLTTHVITPMRQTTTNGTGSMMSISGGSNSTMMMTTTSNMSSAGSTMATTGSTTRSTTTVATTMSTTTSSGPQARFATTLGSNGSSYCPTTFCGRSIFYYDAVQFTVPVSGNYTIVSSSNIDTYGFIYNTSFNPSFPSRHQIAFDDDGNGQRQFRLAVTLQANMKYVVVATTYYANTSGDVVIIATGPVVLTLSRVIIAYNWNMSMPTTFNTTSVSSSIGSFCRYGVTCTNTVYYVSTMVLSVPTTGLYSISSNSSVHMYASIYDNDFFPNASAQNLLIYDDGSVSNNQFNFTVILENIGRVILAMTTYDPGVSVNFTVASRRLATVNLTST